MLVLTMLLIKKIKSILKNNRLLAFAYGKYSKRSLSFNRQLLFHNVETNERIDLDDKNFYKNIENNIQKINNKAVSKEINSVAGWVPYINGKTKSLIFNFFSQNYSLRKNLLLRYSIININKIVKQEMFWIKPQVIFELDDKKFLRTEGQILIVELFHPYIKKNHGDHDGHLRFWGEYFDNNNTLSCITHSMPISFENHFINKEILSRSYFHETNNKKLLNYSLSNLVSKINGRIENYGFGSVLDLRKGITSIWHVAPKNDKKNLLQKSRHIAYCPNVKNLDPYILIDEMETGVKYQEISISILKDNKIIKEKKFDFEGTFFKKISEIFGKIENEYLIMIVFSSYGHSYFNIHYNINNNYGDSVHSHQTNWNPKVDSFFQPVESNGNTRKFFFFGKTDETNYILVLNNCSLKNSKSIDLKLHILTDNNEEFILNKKLESCKPCTIINLNEDLIFLKNKTFKNAIIQLESYDYNIDGSMLHVNKDYIASDHLTGG